MPPSAPPNNHSPGARVSEEEDAKKTSSGALVTQALDETETTQGVFNSSQQQLQQNGAYSAAAANPSTAFNNTLSNLSPYGSALGGLYGAGMMGAGLGGMYGGGYGGMMGSPYGMMGPMSGLTQFLMGVQNVIFSLGQAVQIVGMNAEAVKHLLESAVAMFDHAAATWHEMQALEAQGRATESEEMKKRRRRLRALRWALVAAVTYAGYAVIRKLLSSRRRRPAIEAGPQGAYNVPTYYNSSAYAPPPPTYGGYGSYPSATTAGPYNSGYGGAYF